MNLDLRTVRTENTVCFEPRSKLKFNVVISLISRVGGEETLHLYKRLQLYPAYDRK